MPVARHRACWSLLAVAVVLSLVMPASPALADDGVAPGDTVVGELVQAWPEQVDPDQGADQPLSWITTEGGDSVRVPTDDVDDLPVGATVEVTLGRQVRDEATQEAGMEPAHAVVDADVVAAPDTAPAPASAPYTDEVTVALVQPPGTAADGVTVQQLVDAVNGPVATFWQTETAGVIRLHASAATPSWITTTAGCDTPYSLWSEVAADVGFVPGAGKHLLIYIPGYTSGQAPACAYGLAQVGAGRTAGGYLYVRAAATSVVAHELGHNFGLGHSSELQCDRAVDTGSCRTRSYYDFYDVMGASWEQLGSLNAAQASLLGVRGADVQSVTASGTYQLVPASATSGTRALRLVGSNGVATWLEYRSAAGQDAWLGTAENWPGLQAGVTVRESSNGSDTSLLLDPSPSAASRWDADMQTALPPGTTLPVAGGAFSVTVVSTSAEGATLDITARSLNTVEALAAGQSLASPSGRYRLVVQTDGNVVEYADGTRAVWSSRTAGSGIRLVNQADGNVVLYDHAGVPLWSTRTSSSLATSLVLQDDGNLVLYRLDGRVLWFTGPDRRSVLPAGASVQATDQLVSPNGLYSAVVQSDGNLVVYGPGGRVVFASRTSGSGVRLLMQGDGNAVLYSSTWRPLWSTGTGPDSGSVLVMQDDGNLVVYRSDGRPAWSAR